MIRLLRRSFFFFLITVPAFATDLEVSARYDALYWSPTRTDSEKGRTYDGSAPFWGLEGSLTQELTDNLSFEGGVADDPVLRWRVYGKIRFELQNLSIQFAPFLGTLNSQQKWFNPGMEARFQYTWPGLFYAGGGFLTTFAPVSQTGDYYLSCLDAEFGALMESGIISFHIEDKAATFQKSATLATVDGSTRYWLDTEMFLKNFPLRWAIVTGYQITKRTYAEATEVKTTLHSALLGARASWDFGSGTSVYLEAESAIFNFGWDAAILSVPSTTAPFQAVAGARYHW